MNPPGNGPGNTSAERSDQASLEEVEQILDEIESLVSGDGREETARPKPVLEDVSGTRDLAETGSVEAPADEPEVDRLQVDLEQAIVRELGTTPDPRSGGANAPPEVEPVARETSSPEPRTSERRAETVEVQPEDSGIHIQEVRPTEVHPLLAPFVRFMEGFSARDRMLINVFAISMALWVPLVWWLAMTTTPSIEGTLGGESSMDREPSGIRSTIPARPGTPGVGE